MTNTAICITCKVKKHFPTRVRLMVSGNNSDVFNMCRKYTAESDFEKTQKGNETRGDYIRKF